MPATIQSTSRQTTPDANRRVLMASSSTFAHFPKLATFTFTDP
jgi:hypothetical protein